MIVSYQSQNRELLLRGKVTAQGLQVSLPNVARYSRMRALTRRVLILSSGRLKAVAHSFYPS